ncbi:hypothetical protein E4U32_003235 [Claviceps aff. humidiphila group G2b]|nr:hypothetical protein E4U32_003235 [Claviceps aff. humidiphila group G2b]
MKESIVASAEEANEAELRRQHREWKRLKKQEDEKLKQLKRQEDEKLKEGGNMTTSNAMYRNPLLELPMIPSSDSVQTLDKSRGTPIGEGHDKDIFAAIHGPLDSGDFDEQDVNDEAICELDLTPQVHSEEEPDLPPVPPSSPPLGRPP